MTDESGQAGLRIAADARPPRPHRDRHCPEPLVATPGFRAQYKAEAGEGAAFLDRLRLEKVLARFEDAWQHGQRPKLDDYLQTEEVPRQVLLAALVQKELAYRLRAGETPRIEDFLEAYPELGAQPAVVLDLIACEYRLRQQYEPGLPRAEFLRVPGNGWGPGQEQTQPYSPAQASGRQELERFHVNPSP